MGRSTFDVDLANDKFEKMLRRLEETELDFVGSSKLLFDAETTRVAINDLIAEDIDRLLILQVTFTDASSAVEAARLCDVPLAIGR